MPAARPGDALAPGVTGHDRHGRAARPAPHTPPWRQRPALSSSSLPGEVPSRRAPLSWHPQQLGDFLCTSILVSACVSCWLRRAWSRSSGATRWARGSRPRAWRPRFFGVWASNIPCSRGRRQVVRWAESMPSRRHRAPTCPGAGQASATANTRPLSAAVQRRRYDTDETSTSRHSRPGPASWAEDSAMAPIRVPWFIDPYLPALHEFILREVSH